MATHTTSSETVATWIERDRGPIEVTSEAARILCVEDEHLVALDIQHSLERMGHTVVVVYKGEEAVAQVAKRRFDLVLMDIKLGGRIDGIQAAQTIRATYDVPIIYLTAYADNTTLERARMTEPYGYVLKPFQERELKAAIGMALQRHGTDRHRIQQERLQRFLADASARLADSLDYQAVASGAAELLVPAYADWCTLHLGDELDGDAVPTFSHTRPETANEHATNGDGAHMLQRVLDRGRSELAQLSDAEALRDALGQTHGAMLTQLGARSVICVPVRARDHMLGAFALVAGRTRPRYGPADLLWAEDFCHRLGMALDNALLYRKAERAILMRDDVLAIVSHDLRSPLGTILMQAEVLTDQPDHAKVGGQIARSAQRMNRLIGDLLDASALNAGKLALDCRIHAVNDLLNEAVEMFRSQAESRGVELVGTALEPSAYVKCDSDRIVQVLSNLIGNAIKFTPRGGKVIAAVSRCDNGIEVEVTDTGRGIPPEQVPHLFDRFWRGKAHRHGAGLGLFIARGIIASHGATLALDSKPGVGSRFSFRLPEVEP